MTIKFYLFLKQAGLTQNGVTSAYAKTPCIAPDNVYCEVNITHTYSL